MTSSYHIFFLYWPLALIAQYILPQSNPPTNTSRILSSDSSQLLPTPLSSSSPFWDLCRFSSVFCTQQQDIAHSVTPDEWLTTALLVSSCAAEVKHGPHLAKRADSRRQSYSEITDLIWTGWLSLTSTHLIQKGSKHFKMYRQVFHFIVCSVNKLLYYYRVQGEGAKKKNQIK